MKCIPLGFLSLSSAVVTLLFFTGCGPESAPLAQAPKSQPSKILPIKDPVPALGVKPGIEVLAEAGFKVLQGKRVGLITNPTGLNRRFESSADILARAGNFKLVALFSPEHGVRGDVTAGALVANYVDPATGLTVHSLYGKTRKPAPEMLKNLDVVVYDIQDIGLRSYTYISTLALAMEAAFEQGKEFVVLDRPNPLGGQLLDGPMLDPKFRSFVSQLPIPYVYGMTCGELARMCVDEGWLAKGVRGKLTVIPMQGWRRTMSWAETGLAWVPSSPHIPTPETILGCAATGMMGELEVLSNGVGYTLPFLLVGAPWIEPSRIASELNARNLPGLFFRPLAYKPYYGGFKESSLGGVQLLITDASRVKPVEVQVYLIDTLNRLYPSKNLLSTSTAPRLAMFDKVVGGDALRLSLVAGKSPQSIIDSWKPGLDSFSRLRTKYLLYW